MIKLKRIEQPTRIYFFGDTHFGTLACDEQKISETVASIKKDNAYWIGMGDYIDGITHKDPRFDPATLSGWLPANKLDDLPKIQADYYINKVEPIRDTCIGLLNSNHMETIRLEQQHKLQDHICHKLNVMDLTLSALINVFFRLENGRDSYMLKIFCEHGYGFAATVGAALNKISKKKAEIDADIYAMGHVHIKAHSEEGLVGSTNTEKPMSKEIIKACLVSGSYLRSRPQGISHYVERRSLPPRALGSVYVDIRLKTSRDRIGKRNKREVIIDVH